MGVKKTTEQFVTEAITVHGDKYDYSKVVYTGTNIKAVILCPIHGEFEQVASAHIKGYGCKACAMELVQNGNKKSQEQCVMDFISTHKDIYDYSKMQYVNDVAKVTIICKIHGEFQQSPTSHKQGNGCPKCGKLLAAEKRTIKFEEFIQRAIAAHGTKFSYFKEEYKAYKKNTIIQCNDCKLTFSTSPQHHAGLNGTGCPSCASSGFDVNKPAILYYLKVITEHNQILYKIGITNRTIEARFNLIDLSKIEIIKQKLYENGLEALEWETKLKRLYKHYQYKGPKILSSGNTELFTEDIIAMYDRVN